MQMIFSNDPVILAVDLNELHLQEGDIGRVRSSWHYPNPAYEVEFPIVDQGLVRVLLFAHQVRPLAKAK